MTSGKKTKSSGFLPRTDFGWYETYSLLIPVILAGYLVVALQSPPAGLSENYPFFKWHLFPNAPAEKTSRLELMIRSIENEKFDSRQNFFNLGDHFSSAQKRDVRVSKVLAPMYIAMRNGDHAAVARFRDLLENTYMREADSLEYEIVMTGYDPIERYRRGKIESIHTIATFRKGTD